MDKMIYLAMSGAKNVMHQQASNSHNLANINTTGFKADLDAIETKPMYGPGHPVSAFAVLNNKGADHSSGEIKHTGRPLDIAINGDGLLSVQDKDGTEGYTRAGDLRVSASGLLETSSGYPVLGNGGPIAIPPYQNIEIGSDGTISIVPAGQDAKTLAVIDRIKLVNPDTESLNKGETGIFHSSEEAVEADSSVTLINGSLESSNVNSVASLVKMIELSRHYEMQVKMMKTAEEADEAANKIIRMN